MEKNLSSVFDRSELGHVLGSSKTLSLARNKTLFVRCMSADIFYSDAASPKLFALVLAQVSLGGYLSATKDPDVEIDNTPPIREYDVGVDVTHRVCSQYFIGSFILP